VSRATVSYVLNDVPHSRVGAETRARVLAAAAELGYVPHAPARSLRAGRSNLILLPVRGLPSVGPAADYFRALIAALHRLGYEVIFHADREEREVDAPRAWASLRPAGIIVEADRLTPAALDTLRSAGMRAILAVGPTPSPLAPTLVVDHAAVGSCAVSYLTAMGYRRIAAIVPRDGWRREIGEAQLRGIDRLLDLEVERVDLAFDDGEAARLAACWADGAHPSAVFTHNDEYGMLLLRALLDAGIAVPGRIALIGADDLPLCSLVRPRLTSIHLDVAPSAERVSRLLHSMIGGSDPEIAAVELLRPRVVPREST